MLHDAGFFVTGSSPISLTCSGPGRRCGAHDTGFKRRFRGVMLFSCKVWVHVECASGMRGRGYMYTMKKTWGNLGRNKHLERTFEDMKGAETVDTHSYMHTHKLIR